MARRRAHRAFTWIGSDGPGQQGPVVRRAPLALSRRAVCRSRDAGRLRLPLWYSSRYLGTCAHPLLTSTAPSTTWGSSLVAAPRPATASQPTSFLVGGIVTPPFANSHQHTHHSLSLVPLLLPTSAQRLSSAAHQRRLRKRTRRGSICAPCVRHSFLFLSFRLVLVSRLLSPAAARSAARAPSPAVVRLRNPPAWRYVPTWYLGAEACLSRERGAPDDAKASFPPPVAPPQTPPPPTDSTPRLVARRHVPVAAPAPHRTAPLLASPPSPPPLSAHCIALRPARLRAAPAITTETRHSSPSQTQRGLKRQRPQTPYTSRLPQTMDAAAKTVESLSEHILPEKPHHLSYHTNWRYRVRPDDPAPGSRPRFEEWHNTRLQYMTLVSQADRGTLMTRSYYDMREEPPKPVPREVSALAAGGDKKKKLSLSDYKNKKTGTPSSASPPEPAIAKKLDGERVPPSNPDRLTVANTSNPHGAAEPKPSKRTPDSRKLDGLKAPDSRPSLDGKSRPARDGPDTTLPPKPPSLPPKPPSPAARKRLVDVEDEFRPQKRSKPDDRRPIDERPPPLSNRDDPQRRKDRLQASARDSLPPKEDRLSSSSSLPNGRSILKGAVNTARNPSPGARPRGDSTNGVRPSLGGSNRGTPTKSDASKSFVPPLLSPLHLSFDDQNRTRGDGDEGPTARKKKRDDSRDAAPAAKTKKSEALPLSKKNRPPAVIPPLLSPTLPPAVEIELRRKNNASPEPSDDKSRDGRDALGIKKDPASDNGNEEPAKPGPRRKLLVTLDIPKQLRPTVRKILALPPARKDAAKRDRDKEREKESERERDRAGSDDESQAPPARKRPVGAVDSAADSQATKRPRVSDTSHLSRVAATPSTPSRRSTAMSRASSGNSMANTPGEGVQATPTTSVDRRPNGQGVTVTKPEHQREMKTLLEMQDRLKKRAKGLKHDSDSTFQKYNAISRRHDEDKMKYGFALALECIITFTMAFQAMNPSRRLSKHRGDYATWFSMIPLLDSVYNEMRREGINTNKPVFAALLVLHCTCVDEVLRYASNLDSRPLKYEEVITMERQRTRYWPWVGEINSTIADPDMRIDVKPWYTIDEVTNAALRVVRNWCAQENIDWTPDPMLAEYWPFQRGHA
ncbi:hypothetical protein Purlil1_806 [Purpureocillium lilacinum]|uniref:Uncharacterized protein n=1 Tax=Purpureocillium lilacinum TaxID=33203 RepID=A0ABR0CFL4_PURLI|nr:hypothetical protein Purlil1_806 [Purpureocillium lilacinum]